MFLDLTDLGEWLRFLHICVCNVKLYLFSIGVAVYVQEEQAGNETRINIMSFIQILII